MNCISYTKLINCQYYAVVHSLQLFWEEEVSWQSPFYGGNQRVLEHLNKLRFTSGDESFDSDDDAKLSDDSQGGGKPVVVCKLL